MNTPRNAPCPCGSGKKYKACCLEKDEAAAREAHKRPVVDAAVKRKEAQATRHTPVAAETPTKPERVLEPVDLARDAYWAQFEEAEIDQQIDLLHAAITQPVLPNLLDGELIFESFNAIFYATTNSEGRDRFDALVDTLRQIQPTQYLEEAHVLLDWQITNALVTKRDEAVQRFIREYAQIYRANDFEELYNLVKRLAYHGQTRIVCQLVDETLPQLRNSDDDGSSFVDELAAFAVDGLLFNRLEQTPPVILSPSSPDEGELLAHFKAYLPALDPHEFANRIRFISEQGNPAWVLADFDPDAMAFDNNLRNLTLAFIPYLRRDHALPYFRAKMASESLFRYLRRRADGDLEPRTGLVDHFTQQNKPLPKRQRRRFEHVLCPDFETLDRFLGDLLNIFNMQYYDAAALFEALPAWLDFLERHQLIELQQRIVAIEDCKRLQPEVLRLFEKHTSDPTMYQQLAAWHE